MGISAARHRPPVAITNAAIVFVPARPRPSSDPALRRDFLQVGERLARLAAPAAADIALEAAASATCIPVDAACRGRGATMASWAPISGCASRTTCRCSTNRRPRGPGRLPGPVLRFAPQFFDARTGTVWACLGLDRFTPDIVAEHAIATPSPGDDHRMLRWPRWGRLVPRGVASLEAAEAQARLRIVLRLHEHGETRAALVEAETALVQRWIEVTIRSRLEFWEIGRRHCGEEAVLFEAEGQFDIAAASWPSLLGDPRFRAAVAIPTVVPVLHGFVGLVWWQAVQALRAGTVPRGCAHCARPLRRACPTSGSSATAGSRCTSVGSLSA